MASGQVTALDVLNIIAPARRHLGVRRTLFWTNRGLLAGACGAVLTLTVAHLHAFPATLGIAAVILVAATVGGLIAGIRRWPDNLQTARAVDRRFNLHDRVTTALELRASQWPLATLQREDAGRRLHGLDLRQSADGLVRGREAGMTATTLLLVLVLALTLHTTSAGTAQRASADQQRIHRTARTGVPRLVRSLNANLPASTRRDVTFRNLNLALQHLRFQLQHATSRSAALRAISATEQQLQRIAASLHPIRPAAAAQLSRALASLTGRPKPVSLTGKRALRTAAAALNRLASEVSHMSASQRAALARSLARAANATADSTLRYALRQAASSLGYSDPQSAIRALQQAASGLSRSSDVATAQSRINATSSSLEALKGQVSGLSGAHSTPSSGTGTSGKGQGKSGRGSGQGNAKGSGKGSGSGKGAGSGQGTGRGQGAGHSRSAGSGHSNSSGSSGAGGTGGHGIGGGRGGAGGHGAGHAGPRVFIPGKPGKGSHIIQTGPSGAPLGGSTVPYRQVIGRYAQTARDALDHASLPPQLQTYVRQ